MNTVNNSIKPNSNKFKPENVIQEFHWQVFTYVLFDNSTIIVFLYDSINFMRGTKQKKRLVFLTCLMVKQRNLPGNNTGNKACIVVEM